MSLEKNDHKGRGHDLAFAFCAIIGNIRVEER